MTVGEKIEAFLAANADPKTGKPMTPTAFARLAGTSRQNIQNLIKGSVETPRAALRAVASALRLKVDELLDPAAPYDPSGRGPLSAPSAAGLSPDKPPFASRLFDAMTERKVTAAKLGERLHVPKSQIDQWLRQDGDMPSAVQIFAIADALPASARWLATGVGELSGTDVAVPLRMPLTTEKYRLLLIFDRMPELYQQQLLAIAETILKSVPVAENVVPLHQPGKKGRSIGK